MSKPLSTSFIITTLALAAGCNGFTGADAVGLGDGPLASGEEEVVGGAVARDTPAPKLISCAYPDYDPGAIGVSPGQFVSADTSWVGYRPGATEASEIHLTEFFDCDGSKGYDAILISTSKFNCPSCNLEAGELESYIAKWRDEGLEIAVITLLLDDPSSTMDPLPEHAKLWQDEFGFENVFVAADPNFSMVPGNSVGTPQLTYIDPRTMEVTFLQEGYGDGVYADLENLARSNANGG